MLPYFVISSPLIPGPTNKISIENRQSKSVYGRKWTHTHTHIHIYIGSTKASCPCGRTWRHSHTHTYTQIYRFREGILPMWEDTFNSKGGKWTYNEKRVGGVTSSTIDNLWYSLCFPFYSFFWSHKRAPVQRVGG